MSNNNQNKPGYKHTTLGWIPEEWEIFKLKEVCDKIQDGNYGGEYPTPDEFLDEGVPFLTSKALGGEGTLIVEKFDYISESKHLKLKKAQLKLNDILFTNRGANVGVIGFVDERISNGNIGPQLTLLRASHKMIDYRFLKQVMKSAIVQNQVRHQDSGSAMNFFGIGETAKFKLLVPPFTEQHKIATILSTWDKAITKTQQLIAQLQQRNKGLMRRLLSGEKRLKEFEGEWKKVAIGDVLLESRIPSTNNNPDKRITVRLNQKGVEKRDVRGTEAEDATYYFIRKKGQFIYGKQNLHKGAFGIIPDFLDRFESSQDIPAFDFKNGFNPHFFIYYLGQDNIFPALEKYATGTGSKRIHPENLFKIYLSFPDFNEQTEIVKVVDAAVSEVKLQEQHLAALQLQKKGLMQKLLTGEVRVKI